MALLAVIGGTLGGAAFGALVVTRAARQCRRPTERAGREVVQRMNRSHAGVTAWGLGHVAIGSDFQILDVGCGGGRTIDTLASAAPQGKVFGIDYSEASVEIARETNQRAIDSGHVDIQLGSVSQLPFPDGRFDLVTAVETHYYWPDLPNDVREVMRVLKPGGTFVIIAETYRGRQNDWLFRPAMQLLLRAAYLTPAQHRELLAGAGFGNVRIFEERPKGWICAMGTRPPIPPRVVLNPPASPP